MEKDYRDYIQDILDSIDEIYMFIGQMSREEFLNDRKTVKAVLRNLEIVYFASHSRNVAGFK
jgi:uncharacterized protein with HEPN domain